MPKKSLQINTYRKTFTELHSFLYPMKGKSLNAAHDNDDSRKSRKTNQQNEHTDF